MQKSLGIEKRNNLPASSMHQAPFVTIDAVDLGVLPLALIRNACPSGIDADTFVVLT